jgi:hypothetical protein
MRPDYLAEDARHARLARREASRPRCYLCGKRTPHGIHVRRSLVEVHHIVGQHYDPDATVLLCRECHHKVTEANRSAGASMHPPASVLEAIISVLRSSGTWMPLVGTRLRELADQLERFVTVLDQRFPGWRDLDGAQ